jgi:hypothetical protein
VRVLGVEESSLTAGYWNEERSSMFKTGGMIEKKGKSLPPRRPHAFVNSMSFQHSTPFLIFSWTSDASADEKKTTLCGVLNDRLKMQAMAFSKWHLHRGAGLV